MASPLILSRRLLRLPTATPCRIIPIRALHTTSTKPATPLPITAHGPPPPTPVQPANPLEEWRTRHGLARENVKTRKRFWRDAFVVEVKNGYHIHLDKRILKTPEKHALSIPSTKPLLALALATEWASLRSSKDAVKPHLVPLTQLSSRVIDIASTPAVRIGIVDNLLPYLDTDTLLCIAPTTPPHLQEPGRKSLRELQLAAAEDVVGALKAGIPELQGAEIRMVDGDYGFLGNGRQEKEVREVLRNWALGLDNWQLIGLERIVLTAKSFVVGARMVVEWGMEGGGRSWGVEEAARAAEIEVRFQTSQWGEVEDSHDVEKEDIRRQIGAGWLLIASEEKA